MRATLFFRAKLVGSHGFAREVCEQRAYRKTIRKGSKLVLYSSEIDRFGMKRCTLESLSILAPAAGAHPLERKPSVRGQGQKGMGISYSTCHQQILGMKAPL